MISIMRYTLSEMLELSGRDKHLGSGETLFYLGDRVRSVFLIRQGSMTLRRQTPLGTTLNLQTAQPGSILAEASVYSSHYHCDAIAAEPTRVHVFSKGKFRAQLTENPQLAEVWATHLASSMQAARLLAEIRSLRTVADRLDAWISAGNVIPEKGYWQDLASELGVTREALYRELARYNKARERL